MTILDFIMANRKRIEEEINFIKENNFNGYIDKYILISKFGFSEKTAERRLAQANVKHMKPELIEMMSDISSGMPSLDVAEKYNCSLTNVNQFSRRHNLEGRHQYRHSGYNDPYFFDKIDSIEKAYIIGFIAADGHVSDKEIKITLSEVDLDILVKIKEIIGFNNNIRIFNKDNVTTVRKYSSVSFGTSEMIKSLRDLGFYKNKTLRFSTPNIDKDLLLYFYRGLVDGDGSFSKYIANDGYERYSFSLCGTMDCLISFRDFFIMHGISFNAKIRKRFNTKNCCYSLYASGKNNVLKLLDLLYKDSDNEIVLSRKFEKYKKFKI